MISKDTIIIISLLAAITVISFYSYSYVFLDNKVAASMSLNTAPSNYPKLTLPTPDKALKLFYDDGETIIIQPKTLQTWVQEYNRDYTKTREMRPNPEAINDYLNKLAEKINTPPINARLDYRDGKIVEFDFPTNGKVVDNGGTTANIYRALYNRQEEAEITFTEIEPKVTLEQIDSLGIKKLIGKGESNFSGSSAARIHNIKTASRLYDGYMVKPGEEFSFNQILGDVDAVNGYMPELVIKSHGLVKEYGGGICQVATTAFRAAINSGLKIVERKPHSFPVKYYNPQGFDATIYPGQVDLRFINDTPNNIIMQTRIVGTKIYFEFYGDDDRVVTVTQPTQYDVQPSGALKAVFYRTIEGGGETKKEEFRSSYRSPALYPTLHNPLE